MSTLNHWQRKLAERYHNGEFDHVTDSNDIADTHDPIFIFMMGELSGASTLDEALFYLQNAYSDIGESMVILGGTK